MDGINNVREKINSPDLSLLQCIDLLRIHCSNIGLLHALVNRLYSYPYEEVEFFIPQFVQLLVMFETDSVALEEFLLDHCASYPHFSLTVFWVLQAFLFELRNEPTSYAFQIVRNLINKLQDILFNYDIPSVKEPKFRENPLPALVLCGAVASSFATPSLNNYISKMIKSQGKQQRSLVFKLANFQKTLTKNLTMKNQATSTLEAIGDNLSKEDLQEAIQIPSSSSSPVLCGKEILANSRRLANQYLLDDSEETGVGTDEEDTRSNRPRSSTLNHAFSIAEDQIKINTAIKLKKRRSLKAMHLHSSIPGAGLGGVGASGISGISGTSGTSGAAAALNSQSGLDRPSQAQTQSLPDLTRSMSRPELPVTESEYLVNQVRYSADSYLAKGWPRRAAIANKSYQELLKILRVNYSKKQTEFMMSLQDISMRLSLVPKAARVSALRAELSILNDTILPSEIDIPQLLPHTSNRNKKFHKILRLNINEACVLNSAERVPYLLLIEYLSDEFDFNPFTEYNQKLITEKLQSRESKNSPDISANTTIDNGNNINNSNSNNTINNSNNFDQESITSDAQSSFIAGVGGDDGKFLPLDETDLGELSIIDSHVISGNRSRSQSGNFSPGGSNSIASGSLPAAPQSLNAADTTLYLADQMRIASLMLQQLENSGQANSQQFLSIKTRIIDSMISLQDRFESIDYEKMKELRTDEQGAGQRKLENDFKIGEDWEAKKRRIRKASAYGHLKNWELCSVIVKNGDDLPQEAFACQLIILISNIWKKYGIHFWTKKMKILITSANAGLVETITNSMSIHSIKKSLTELSIASGENSKGRIFTLRDYFEKLFGPPSSRAYRRAQGNFATSLASYSVICYVLQIKDRHNGNIMIDHEGHIIHIDFGFLLGNSPGSNIGFEAAPFKLTTEYIDLLGGMESEHYQTFVSVFKDCFRVLRKEWTQIVSIVELMQKDSNLPCFNNGDNTSVLLKQRLQLQLSDDDLDAFAETYLINKSLNSLYTRWYDQFQLITQGIFA